MKVVYDTCLYIDLLRKGSHLSLFSDRNHVRFLSPLVLMELKAGALTPKNRKIVGQLVELYARVGRILPIPANVFSNAGDILSRLHAKGLAFGGGLINDLLIALSASAIGATLFTRDKHDFSIIEKHVNTQIVYMT